MTKRGNYLFVEKENIYTLSMTPELQDDVGTVGYVEFVKDDDVEKNGAVANIEASKTVMEIQSPLKGTVIARNTAAEENPALLNSADPEENWIVRLVGVSDSDYEALEAEDGEVSATAENNESTNSAVWRREVIE